MRRLSIVLALIVVSGCSFLGLSRRMNHTNVPSEPGSYASLVTAAKALGWRTQGKEPSAKLINWDLQVFPAEGQRIIFTQNNLEGTISFACDGDLKRTSKCIEAADKLFVPAFGATYRGGK